MQSLAKQIAYDGEGATKLVEINARGFKNNNQAKIVARSIGCSNLVKTACFGNDPNWGRIICAAGYSGVAFNPDRISLSIQGKPVLKRGRIQKYNADTLSKAMNKKRLLISINLHSGKGSACFWTCDMSYDYIKINAEYHT
jgi:glutamate N-acetyltransferase/amino-acid N-acetyltransferase